jgi:hypothetical protein
MKLISRNVLVASGMCAFALNACGLSGGPVSGQVIDETTGKPLADAIVVVHWRGSWTKIVGESNSGCYHVETARTDAQGKYQIPAWTRAWTPSDLRFSSDEQTYDVYKAGYTRAVSHHGLAPQAFSMEPYKGSVAYYFEHVLSAPYWNCIGAGASGKNEYRLFRAMAIEAAALAESSAQKSLAHMLAKRAEETLVNRDRPTHYVGDSDRLQNVNPKDAFKKEEVPQ